MNRITLIALSVLSFNILGQSYAPAAGQPGSTAISFSDPKIVSWASDIEVVRGFVNIEDTTIEAMGDNRASFGSPALALGNATTDAADVVSLGDKGVATITFDQPIINGPSFDFAVFENSFSDTYLELAHVEVSSNGIDFVRFPSHSQVQTLVQIHGFGSTNPTMIHNLAGKYRGGYGTPFDLEELKDSAGIDVNNITHVRIIDVVGSVGESATYDSHGNKINEPFSTPYESCGFDLEAVGVINQLLKTKQENKKEIRIYPNPTTESVSIELSSTKYELHVLDAHGKEVLNKISSTNLQVKLRPGIYTFLIVTKNRTSINKVVFN